jgi:hypothetical protein
VLALGGVRAHGVGCGGRGRRLRDATLRLGARLSRPPLRGGARTHLGRGRRADDPRGEGARARRDEDDEERRTRAVDLLARSPRTCEAGGSRAAGRRLTRLSSLAPASEARGTTTPTGTAEAVAGAGLDPMRPYDLRHSFALLLIAECRSVVEVADQRGHAPTLNLNVHGHVLRELAGRERRPGRATHRRSAGEFPRRVRAGPLPPTGRKAANQHAWEAGARTRTGDPFITRGRRVRDGRALAGTGGHVSPRD